MYDGIDLFLCLAVINSNTPATLREMEALEDCDADFLVSTAPFYHGATQEDILEHYKQVIARSSAPVIVYNIPSATHNPIALETVLELSGLDNVAGTKDSSGNFISFSKGLFGTRKEGFAWIQGEDYLCAPALLCGGDGMVSGLSNARVEPCVEIKTVRPNAPKRCDALFPMKRRLWRPGQPGYATQRFIETWR